MSDAESQPEEATNADNPSGKPVLWGVAIFIALASGYLFFLAPPSATDQLKEANDRLEASTDRLNGLLAAEVSNQITMAKFSSLQEGMTYEQVVSILGSSGEVQSSSDVGGFKTVMYGWSNPNGSNMSATIQNGRLVMKAQFGLP